MKTITLYINEALRVKTGTKVAAGTKRTEFPESRSDLIKIISDIIEKNDFKNLKNKISLNHIDVSKITNFEGLFAMTETSGMDALRKVFNNNNMEIEGKKYTYFQPVMSVFYECEKISKGTFPFDISEWDMSNAEDISFMFAGVNVDCDLSNWNVSNVKKMIGTFAAGEPLFDLSEWDVSKVEDMSFLFYYSDFDGDISKWNVSNVKQMNGTFCFSTFDEDISKWNVKNVVSMQYMFRRSYFNSDISNWNVSNVENMQSMFSGAEFNGDISKWDVSKVKNMSKMFKKASFDGDLSDWDVSNVEIMNNMFYQAKFTGENGNIGNWKLKSIRKVYDMFEESNLGLSLEEWKPYMKQMQSKSAYGMFYKIQNPKFREPRWYAVQRHRNNYDR